MALSLLSVLITVNLYTVAHYTALYFSAVQYCTALCCSAVQCFPMCHLSLPCLEHEVSSESPQLGLGLLPNQPSVFAPLPALRRPFSSTPVGISRSRSIFFDLLLLLLLLLLEVLLLLPLHVVDIFCWVLPASAPCSERCSCQPPVCRVAVVLLHLL